jgi:DNA-binding Lrp family transcriptional regulator
LRAGAGHLAGAEQQMGVDLVEPAASTGVSPSTSLERVRALRQRGVIRGYRAEVDLKAVGRPVQATDGFCAEPCVGVGVPAQGARTGRDHRRSRRGAVYPRAGICEAQGFSIRTGTTNTTLLQRSHDRGRLRVVIVTWPCGRPETPGPGTAWNADRPRLPPVIKVCLSGT